MMNNFSFFIRSLSKVAFANIITKPIWLILFIFAARRLGTEQFGLYTYAFAWVLIVSFIIDFGFDYIVVKDISQNNNLANKYFTTIFFSRNIILFVLVALAVLGNVLFDIFPADVFIVGIFLLLFQTITVHLQFIRGFVSAFQDYSRYSWMIAIEKLLLIAFGYLALFYSSDLNFFILALLLGNIVLLIIFLKMLRKRFKIKMSDFSIDTLRHIAGSALSLVVMNLFVLLYFRIDVILLKWILNDSNIIGIYGSSRRIIDFYFAIPMMLMSTAYPIIAKNYLANNDYTIQLATKLFGLISFVTLPICVIVGFNSYEINLIVFGKEYTQGYSGLMLIVWTLIPLGFNYILGNLLIIIKKQNYCVMTLCVASIFNLVLNIFLIPSLSFFGTSISLLMTELLIFIMYTYFTLKFFGNIKILPIVLKLLLIVFTISILFFLMVKSIGYIFPLSITLLSITSVLLLFLLKIIDFDSITKFFYLKHSN